MKEHEIRLKQSRDLLDHSLHQKALEYNSKRETVLQRKLMMEQELDKRSMEFIEQKEDKFLITNQNKSVSLKKIMNTARKNNLKAESKL